MMQGIQPKNESFEVFIRCLLRKILRFTVHRNSIDLDPSKGKTIRDIEPPKTVKKLKIFLGRVSYI